MVSFSKTKQPVLVILISLFVSHCPLANAAPAKKTSRTSAAHSGSHSSVKHSKHGKKSAQAAAKKHGQQAIQEDRARMIQAALIREHYLSGEPTGIWDARTQEAMRRYQGAQSWQIKIVPDSRALIKLGLGPTPAAASLNQLVGETHSPAGGGGGVVSGIAQR